jgi:hypothetical protein
MIYYKISWGLVWFLVFNTTFSNISVTLWRSVLLEGNRSTQTLVVIGTDFKGSCKSIYHTIMTAPKISWEWTNWFFVWYMIRLQKDWINWYFPNLCFFLNILLCLVEILNHLIKWGSWWSWSYGSWIYNYLCNQCLLSTRSWKGVLDTTLCDKVCQWLATGRFFPSVSSTNKTDHHNITEILTTVALNTITLSLIKCWYTIIV